MHGLSSSLLSEDVDLVASNVARLVAEPTVKFIMDSVPDSPVSHRPHAPVHEDVDGGNASVAMDVDRGDRDGNGVAAASQPYVRIPDPATSQFDGSNASVAMDVDRDGNGVAAASQAYVSCHVTHGSSFFFFRLCMCVLLQVHARI